jgi:hypothetical protein
MQSTLSNKAQGFAALRRIKPVRMGEKSTKEPQKTH